MKKGATSRMISIFILGAAIAFYTLGCSSDVQNSVSDFESSRVESDLLDSINDKLEAVGRKCILLNVSDDSEMITAIFNYYDGTLFGAECEAVIDSVSELSSKYSISDYEVLVSQRDAGNSDYSVSWDSSGFYSFKKYLGDDTKTDISVDDLKKMDAEMKQYREDETDADKQYVWASDASHEYHRYQSCVSFNRQRLRQVTLSSVIEKGYSACPICL